MSESDDRQHLIRQRAFSLWEADGRPEGRDEEYWFRAERLLADEQDPAQPTMTEVPPL